MEEKEDVPASAGRRCENGHEMELGDLLCLDCGAAAVTEEEDSTAQGEGAERVLTCGELRVELPGQVADHEFFTVELGKQRVRFFPQGLEPDATLQDRLLQVSSKFVATLRSRGRVEEDRSRYFEVWENSRAGEGRKSLAELDWGDFDKEEKSAALESLAVQLAQGISALHQQEVLLRDLNRESIGWLKNAEGEVQVELLDLSQAAVADFGVSREPAKSHPAYIAPEAAVGVYEEASDWWALGALLLDLLTDDDESRLALRADTMLLNVVTRGILVPDDLPGQWVHLLKGLLTRDPAKRWSGTELLRWLHGERGIPQFYENDVASSRRGESLKLAGEACYSPQQWALAAAAGEVWNEARQQLESGSLATWLLKLDESDQEFGTELDRLSRDEALSADERLAAVVVLLNSRLPLSFRGELVNPRWLLENTEQALRWLEGDFIHRLARIERVDWLVQMSARRERAEAVAKEKMVQLDRDTFRAASLVADDHQLRQRWMRRRHDFPHSHHRGLASLTEKDQPLPEELLVVLAARVDQFTAADGILKEAKEEAQRAEVEFFDQELARERFDSSYREIFRELNQRLSGFVRCDQERLDEWADVFRFEQRLSLPQALVLLQVPEGQWQTPPEQEYLGSLFDFFHRKILQGIQSGPLLRLRVSKNSRNIDLTELGGEQLPADTLLERILSREEKMSQIDPGVFISNPKVERRLRRLHRVGVDYQRDTGIDSVYLGFPFLLFRPATSGVTAKPKRAPLFLWPVEIHAMGGRQGRIKISYDHQRGDYESGGVELNPALQPLLKQDEQEALLAAVAEALVRSRLDAAEFYELCAAALPLKVRHDAELSPLVSESPEMRHGEGHLYSAGALFLCDFSQQTIAKDIRQLRKRGLKSGALSHALRMPVKEEVVEAGELGGADDQVCDEEQDPYFILPADPSQQRAVLDARGKEGVAIQGPPGTGKSQTIVNILADCIGRGEKVLVVCQKYAALEVVARRMEEEGLGDRFFMIEDAKRSRRTLIKALRSQTAAGALWRSDAEDDSRGELASTIASLEDELCASADAIQNEVKPSQLTYAQIVDRLIESQELERVSAFHLREFFEQISKQEVDALAEMVKGLASLWLRSNFFASPWQGLDDFSTDSAALLEFREDFQSFAAAEQARAVFADEAHRVFSIADAETMATWLESHRQDLSKLSNEQVKDIYRWRDFFDCGDKEQATALQGDLQQLALEASAVGVTSRQHDLGAPLALLKGQCFRRLVKSSHRVRAAAGSFFKRILPGFFFAKRALVKFYDEHGDYDGGQESDDVLSALHTQIDWEITRRALQARLREVKSTLRVNQGGGGGKQLSPNQILQQAEGLRKRLMVAESSAHYCLHCPVAEVFGKVLSKGSSSAVEDFVAAAGVSLKYAEVQQVSLGKLQELSRWFDDQWVAAKRLQIQQAEDGLDEIELMHAEIDKVEDFVQFRVRHRELPDSAKKLFQLLEEYREGVEEQAEEEWGELLENTIKREALLAWKGLAESRHPALLMNAAEFDAKVSSLRRAVEAMRKSTAETLKRPWQMSLIANATTWLEILKLTGANARRLREVFDQGIDRGLFNLRPVWLASPETVSRIFPLRENLFDVVIFDEASQMPVELAVPSLYRARRAVISGDEKQLPPTNFFRSSFDDADEDDADEAMIESGIFFDADLDEETRQRLASKATRREVKDCSDLLQLAKDEMPNSLLSIHYRSRWRHLIAFSNHAFYEGRLSIPVHHPDGRIREHQPLELRQVNGLYENQTNQGEAEAVIDFLAEHWSQPNPPSVGIVTFNMKQAELIQDEIEARMETDEVFRRNCECENSRSQLDAYFVRNLENVQGDERDVIVFSTTFGPDAKGRFIRNFGPASQRGGERRLNVAVTRSREKMIIFTSMPIADVAEGFPGEGESPREVLKAYLSFAQSVSQGDFKNGDAILNRARGRQQRVHDRSAFDQAPEQRAFVRDVVKFLREQGFAPEAGLDPGDAFHFDLALINPKNGRYGLAIECDPPLHRDLDSAQAREIWRPDTMAGTIPKVIRLSSRAWLDDLESEEKRLLKAAKGLR
ncbi:MAG: AAA domain-containing protein [Verrucomicrobiales bacterium]|nr:AAA domain-containing protein [Verrucomicrobiales bacterium]